MAMTPRETITAAKAMMKTNQAKLEEAYEIDRKGREIVEYNTAKIIAEEKLLAKYPWALHYEPWCDGVKLVATEFNLKGWPELAEFVNEGDMMSLDEGVSIDTTDESNIEIIFGVDGAWRERLPGFVKKFGIKLDTSSILTTIESVEATTRLLRSLYDEALHLNSTRT